MTNTKLLRSVIDEQGFKLSFIAGKLDITSYALQMKINNVHEFKASEIQLLCDLLNIKSLERKNEIFFALQVDETSTR